jgi:hypothetical protein
MKFSVYCMIRFDEDAANIKAVLGDNIAKLTWVDRKNLKEYKLTPPSIELFTKLRWIASYSPAGAGVDSKYASDAHRHQADDPIPLMRE